MGLSSNQARFLSLTARQVDMEQRIQQICQRRLRLSSELENVATAYNNQISNRKMFLANQANQGIQGLSLNSLKQLGYKVINTSTDKLVVGLMNNISAPNPTDTVINSEQDFMNLLVNGGASALSGHYVLNCDIDLSDNPAFTKAVINGNFTGTFDGQGHTISGANITAVGTDQTVGIFAQNSGSIKNLAISDAHITASGNSSIWNDIGVLVGGNSGTIDNVAVTDSSININGDGYTATGGLAGGNVGTISHSYAETDITGNNNIRGVGGLVGDAHGTILQSYATGNITLGNTAGAIGGLYGYNASDTNITNCYSTGDIKVGTTSYGIGGFGGWNGTAGGSIKSSYTTGNVTIGTGNTGGIDAFVGHDSSPPAVDSSNFYKNNMTSSGSAVDENNSASRPQNLWNTGIWDLSGAMPELISNGTMSSGVLEKNLRNGTYSLVREADEFTQDPITLNGEKYQEVDWRSTPEIYDELYRGDDTDAENKYDKIISEINAQDKKLQLEQTSVEVEYKAVSSEREAVKKILDTNAQSSFKYFS